MNDELEQYRDNAARFGSVVADAATGSWQSPSPCEEWTAADVLRHVVDTQRSFLAKQGLDPGEQTAEDPVAVWDGHLAGLLAAVGDGGALERSYDGYFGRTTVGDTLAHFYGFDMTVHRWDLGRALGVEVGFTEEEMDALDAGIEGFGDALYSEGVCKPALPTPAHADRQERLLARMGRDPRSGSAG